MPRDTVGPGTAFTGAAGVRLSAEAEPCGHRRKEQADPTRRRQGRRTPGPEPATRRATRAGRLRPARLHQGTVTGTTAVAALWPHALTACTDRLYVPDPTVPASDRAVVGNVPANAPVTATR